MKTKYLSILIFLSLSSFFSWGQVTEAALDAALENKDCQALATALDRTPLVAVSIRLKGAKCYYYNGAFQQAAILFQEIRLLETRHQQIANYWEAKCYAALGDDEATLARLKTIPSASLRATMLSDDVFHQLQTTNAEFTRLKQSLEPGFNLWTGLLSVVAFSGLVIGLLLFTGQSSLSAGEKWLSMTILSAALILIAYITIWTKYNQYFPYLQHVWAFLTLLIGPSLYFYLKDTFKVAYNQQAVLYHLFLPGLCGLLTVPQFLLAFDIDTGISQDVYIIGTSPILLTSHLFFYTIAIHYESQNEWQMDANIKTWTQIVIGGLYTYAVAFLSYFILVRCSFFNPEWDYAISLVMAIGILMVGYMGLIQRRVFQSEPITHFLPGQKYRTSSLTKQASESIKKGMERLLKEEQVFKENELRLADLAAYLDISKHQLSQVINEHYGVNFFELINTYRVNYVKRLLSNPAYNHYTIIQMAYEAGFNNKASFNRYFKKAMGMTPSAYRIKMSTSEKG